MKKLFTFFAAALVALAVNATSITLGTDDPKAVHANAISAAVSSYDTINLKAGIYTESGRIAVSSGSKVIKAISDTVIIKAVKDNQVSGGAKVTYDGIFFDASSNTSYRGFTTADASAGNELRFNNCEFYGFPKYVITTNSESCTIDSVIVTNCYFHNNTRASIYFPTSSVENQETCYGLIVKNSTFANNDASGDWTSIVDVETKVLPAENIKVLVDHCTFYNNLTKNEDHASVRTHTVLNAEVSNCIFAHPTEYERRATYMDGNPSYAKNCISYNFTVDASYQGHTWMTNRTNCTMQDPKFADAANGDFTLSAESPAIDAGTDGKTLGDPRWWPVISYPETDFSGDGYVFNALNAATIDPSIEVNTNYGEENPYFRYTGSTGTFAEATWKIEATRGCLVNVTVNMADNSWNQSSESSYQNGKHIFVVELLDENGQRVDTVAEGDYKDGKQDGYNTYPTVNLGTFAVPEAGVYTVKLLNPRAWSKCGVNNVTLAYASDLPSAAAKGGWDSWANVLEFTLAKDAKTASVKKTFNKGDEFEFKMLINGTENENFRANGWWFKRDATTATDITGNGDNMKIIADYTGEYTFTWTFATNTLAVTFPEPTLENGWYLVGTFNGVDAWTYADLTAAKKFEVNPDNDQEFVITIDLKKDDRFKAAYVYLDEITEIKPAGTGNDYLVTEWTAGEKTIYYRVEYYQDWGGHFYIEANEPVVTYSDFEIVLYEGQLGTDKSNPNNKYLAIDGENYTYTNDMPIAYNAYLTNTNYNSNQHGYTNLVVTMPVEAGNYYKVTLGTCEYGNGAGSIKKADESVTYKTFNQNIGEGKNYKTNPALYIVSTVFTVAEAQTIKIVCGNYTPYIKVEQVANMEYFVRFVVEEGVRGIVPASVSIIAGKSLTIPANTTLYKDGNTLTGWTDGVNTYAPGDAFTPKDDATLTAVFSENTANLLTATVPVTVQWNFGLTEGAPAVAWEGENKGMGFLVAQATIGETKVDVPLDIDARSGKFANSGRKDYWAQVNAGTKLYIPAKKGAEVEVFTYADPATTTVDKATQTGTWTDNKSQFITTATIDASVMEVQDGQYYRYLKVTYPASEATSISNTEASSKAQKLIENGQIVIIKNGVKYNVLGACLK